MYHVVLHEMFWNLKTWIREPFNREIGERSQGIMSDSPPGKFNLPPPIIDFEIIFLKMSITSLLTRKIRKFRLQMRNNRRKHKDQSWADADKRFNF